MDKQMNDEQTGGLHEQEERLPSPFSRAMGEKVRAARLEARLSQTELARRTGARQAAISAIENGRMEPGAGLLAALAAALERPLNALFPDWLPESALTPGRTAVELELLRLFRRLEPRERRGLLAQAKALAELARAEQEEETQPMTIPLVIDLTIQMADGGRATRQLLEVYLNDMPLDIIDVAYTLCGEDEAVQRRKFDGLAMVRGGVSAAEGGGCRLSARFSAAGDDPAFVERVFDTYMDGYPDCLRQAARGIASRTGERSGSDFYPRTWEARVAEKEKPAAGQKEPLIRYENQYRDFLKAAGVGENDKVASSIYSYISYLKSVSRILGIEITPASVGSEGDVEAIYERLRGKRSDKTIGNYRSALRQYARMVQVKGMK